MWSGLWKNLKNFKIEFLIFSFSIVLNLSALSLFWAELPEASSSGWGQVISAYSFYRKNDLSHVYYEISVRQHVIEKMRLLEIAKTPSIHDTPWYGFMLGLIWKCIGTPSLIYIQIVQIILFSLIALVLWRIILLCFENPVIQAAVMLGFFFYLPLVRMNVIPGRDVWSFYASIVLLYALIEVLYRPKKNNRYMILAPVFFGICQLFRPNVLFLLITLFISAFGIAFFWHKEKIKHLFRTMLLWMICNIVVFWVPFLVFNKITYNRWFVSYSGHALVQAFSTVENPWGFSFSDEATHNFIANRYPGVIYATPEYGDAGIKIFKSLFQKYPLLYIKAFLKSLRQAFFENMPGHIYLSIRYKEYDQIKGFEKIKNIVREKGFFELFFFIIHHYFVKNIQWLGYCGFALALLFKKTRRIAFLCFFGVVCGVVGLLFSHCESRYVIPFYWPFGLFAGYFLGIVLGYFLSFYRLKIRLLWNTFSGGSVGAILKK